MLSLILMKRFPDLNAIVPLVTLILPEAEFRLNLGKAKIEPLKQKQQVDSEQVNK